MQDIFENFDKFWGMVEHVWKHGYMGIDVGKFIEAIGIVLGFLVFRQLFAYIVLAFLKKAVQRSRTELDDQVLDAIVDPLKFIPVVLGVFLAGEHLALKGGLDDFVGHVVLTLLTFNIFWMLVKLVDPFSFLFKKLEKVFTPAMVQWIVKSIKMAFILLGSAAVLETWGVKVGPLVAGLGLFGVAVALGAQDMFKNLIGGLLVIAEQRFHPGDWIKVDGIVEGVVEDIGFRSTMIRRFDKAPVFVPNSKLADNAVTNFSAMTHRRIYWLIGVEYKTSVSQLKLIRDQIESYIRDNKDFANPSEVSTFVRIDSFNDSSIDIMLYCFTKTTDWGEWLKVKEELAYKIKEIVEGAGSGFAFPSQSLYVEKFADDIPETFVPPSNSGVAEAASVKSQSK